MKGQAETAGGGGGGTQTTRRTFLFIIFCWTFSYLLSFTLHFLVYWHGVGPKVFDVTGEIRLLIGCFFLGQGTSNQQTNHPSYTNKKGHLKSELC